MIAEIEPVEILNDRGYDVPEIEIYYRIIRELGWTQELPTEPGNYLWWREEWRGPRLIKVFVPAMLSPGWYFRIPELPTATPVEAAGETKAPVHGVVGGGWDG